MAPVRQNTSYGSRRAFLQRGCGILAALLVVPVLNATGAAAVPAGAAAAPGGRTLKLVALGDSLTAGYMLPDAAAFPNVLQAALRKKGHMVEIANAGVSGDTASGGLARVDWSVPDGTDGVIVELGANDMLRGIDPEITRQALDGIVTRLKGRNIPVMLAGMYAARNLGADYQKRFEKIFTDLAARDGLVLYPFFLEGVSGGAASLALPDGLHPSAEGVRLIVERIVPSVETFLGQIDARGT